MVDFLNPREIRVPFSIGDHGGVMATTDPVQQAAQHILAAVATSPGERVMRPNLGVPVQGLLFETMDPIIITGITSEMRQAINAYVPEVEVMGISADSAPVDNGAVAFAVSFRLRGAGTDEVYTADIFVGGTVVERTYSL